jgi:hypothetical protein
MLPFMGLFERCDVILYYHNFSNENAARVRVEKE